MSYPGVPTLVAGGWGSGLNYMFGGPSRKTAPLGTWCDLDKLILGDSSVVSYWTLGLGGSPTVAHDFKGSRNLTLTNATGTNFVAAAPGNGSVTFASGGYGVNTGTAFNNVKFALSVWCKIASNPVTGSDKGLIFGQVETASKYGPVIYLTSDGKINIAFQRSDGTVYVTSYAGFTFGRWNHIMFNYDAVGNLRVWHNGLIANTNYIGQTPRSDFTSSAGIWLAGTGGTLGFVGVPGTYAQASLAQEDTGSTFRATSLAHGSYTSKAGMWYTIGSTYFGENADVRVTMQSLEVARTAATNPARVTEVSVEVLRSRTLATQAGVANLTFTPHATEIDAKSHMAAAHPTWTITAAATAQRAHNRSAVSNLTIHPGSTERWVGVVRTSAHPTLTFTSAATAIKISTFYLHASSSFTVTPVLTGRGTKTWRMFAKNSLSLAAPGSETFKPAGHAKQPLTLSSHVTYTGNFTQRAATLLHLYSASKDHQPRKAADSLTFSVTAKGHVPRAILLDVSSELTVYLDPENSVFTPNQTATSSFVLSSAPTHLPRERYVSAVTSLSLASPSGHKGLPLQSVSDTLHIDTSAESFKDSIHIDPELMLLVLAQAEVLLPSGQTLPGGDTAVGLRRVLLDECSGDYPFSYEETPLGNIIMANGIDPMYEYDPMAGVLGTLGIDPPAKPTTATAIKPGLLVGRRYFVTRFLDARGRASNPSPRSLPIELGHDGFVGRVDCDANTGLVTVTSGREHLLSTGDRVVISGVQSPEACNGSWSVTVLDDTRFTLDGLVVTSSTWVAGGVWTAGSACVLYSGVPVSTDPKVVRRQILRTLDGDESTYYVDIDTEDLTSTTGVSSKDDEALSAGEPLVLDFEEGVPAMTRRYPPPSHKAVIVAHQGRVFAAVDRTYRGGHAEVTYGSILVQGRATQWKSSFAGRWAYFDGAPRPHTIVAVDEAAQTMVLSAPYSGPADLFTACTVRPAPGERKLVYYSEPGEYEYWPPWNSLAVPEDGDEPTGLYSHDSFLWVIQKRHIYKLTFQSNPATDGFLFLSAERGCLSDRLIAQGAGDLYCMDEAGVHKFNAQGSEDISAPIRPFFLPDAVTGYQLDWSADTSLWHAAADPARGLIRWFVTLVGFDPLTHALCYDYANRRWWLESYVSPISANDVIDLGPRRCIVGSSSRRVFALDCDTSDVVPSGLAVRGQVVSADAWSLTVTETLPASLAGVPVAIVSGTGRGQVREISDSTTNTMSLAEPWAVTPDATSVYQVGGIPWVWQSGWFDLTDSEQEIPRDVEFSFSPASNTQLSMTLTYDHALEPRIWASIQKDLGVRTQKGSPYVDISLDKSGGWARFRYAHHKEHYVDGDGFVSMALSGVQAQAQVRVHNVTLHGAD